MADRVKPLVREGVGIMGVSFASAFADGGVRFVGPLPAWSRYCRDLERPNRPFGVVNIERSAWAGVRRCRCCRG